MTFDLIWRNLIYSTPEVAFCGHFLSCSKVHLTLQSSVNMVAIACLFVCLFTILYIYRVRRTASTTDLLHSIQESVQEVLTSCHARASPIHCRRRAPASSTPIFRLGNLTAESAICPRILPLSSVFLPRVTKRERRKSWPLLLPVSESVRGRKKREKSLLGPWYVLIKVSIMIRVCVCVCVCGGGGEGGGRD